jgi:Ca-activated chloride channel homolog
VPRPSRYYGYLLLLGLLGLAGLVLWRVSKTLAGGDTLRLATPWALLLLAGPLLVAWVRLHLHWQRAPSLWFSQNALLLGSRPGWVAQYARLPGLLRVVALVLIVIALARPQTFAERERTVEGIDIMFVLDLSNSMKEEDLQRNRLDAGQRTIREFLHARQGRGDRMGLVVFAREAMLQCPLTLDYRSLDAIVSDLQIGEVPEIGTAIGDALGLALASLRRSSSASKVIILLSDGDWNRANYMDPSEARDLGVQMGVRVFTVLLGREDAGQAPGVGYSRSQYEVNPAVLRDIASATRGLYFQAGDDAELGRSFDEIRKSLITSENRVMGTTPASELFGYLVWGAFALLLLELLLRMTRFRSFP